jgi:hypothetical protein
MSDKSVAPEDINDEATVDVDDVDILTEVPDNSEIDTSSAEPGEDRWAHATGAIALGVLDAEEQSAADEAIAHDAHLSEEVALLRPVADILRGLYQSIPAPAATAVASTSDQALAATETPIDQPSTKPKRKRKPAPTQKNVGLSRALPSLPWGKVIVGASAALAIISLLWAFALLDKLEARDDEIAAQETEIANLQAAGNASAYLLYPTADGGTAQGTLYHSPANNTAVIDVINLPVLDEDRVYQVWFQQEGSSSWIPGPTFVVNSSGQAVQRLAGDAPTFAQVAISNEPSPGSTEPTGPFLLTGVLAQANG